MGKSKTKDDKSCSSLPPGITADDLTFPKMGDAISYSEGKELGVPPERSLRLYYAKGFGWAICTLLIGSSRSQPDRYYAITLEGKTCRLGKGPHVTQEVTVYVKKSNVERLKKYIDLYNDGLSRAGQIRDRISSRRAEGQERRARGEHSWMWNV